MDLHHSDEGSIQVVRLRLLRVEDVHWVGAAWDGEDGLVGREECVIEGSVLYISVVQDTVYANAIRPFPTSLEVKMSSLH